MFLVNELENQTLLNDLFEQYIEVFKPLIANVEACYEAFPIAIVNEIRAFTDHVARCYVVDIDKEKIEDEVRRAKGHLKRAIYDCYKFLNVHYKMKIERFEKDFKDIDLTSIQKGEFYIKFKQLEDLVKNKVREAKQQESKGNIAYLEFESAYNTYVELYELAYSKEVLGLLEHKKKIISKEKKNSLLFWLVSFITGLTLGLASLLLK